jgi:hypothetical protein
MLAEWTTAELKLKRREKIFEDSKRNRFFLEPIGLSQPSSST